MKILKPAVLFICCCISFTLNAQGLSEDTTAYKMSYEKADSLLISISKGKTNKGNSTYVDKEAFDEKVFVPDELSSDSVSDDTFITITPQTELSDNDSLNIDSTTTVSPDKNRKKALVEKRELFFEQSRSGTVMIESEDDIINLRSINEGTMIGVGGYRMKDQYLSPEKYGGLGFRFMNERMRLLKTSGNKVSRQNIVNVDISTVINGAENANFLSAFADYSVGYHYRLIPDPFFKILVGGSIHGMLGMVYNTRNGNNPMTIHADVDLNFSLLAIYEFSIKKHPITIRYQFESPFIGVLFSPVYDQSYYEIFSLGNTAEILNVYSFQKKLAMRNYLTIDFPIGSTTVRTGYLGSFYTTNVHEIDRYIISHNFMLGFVKEFVAFGGRDMRKRNMFHSAYY